MHLEILNTPPPLSSFTPLSTHESQTPSSFFSSTPVLHFSTRKAALLVATPEPAESEEAALPPLFRGTVEGSDEQVVVKDVDVWVTSASLILYSETKSTGVEIPYPAISLHAIQRLRVPGEPERGEVQGLYMQIELDEDGGYEEDGSWEVTVIPSAAQTQESSTPATADTSEPDTELAATPPPQETITALFAALATCSNLHPDPTPSSPASSDDGDPIFFEGSVGYESLLPGGDLPPPFPGSGGWITAENVGEFFDEEGELKKRRGRGEEDGGEEGEEDGGKWRRTG
ncbi:MAG: hypothetical protein M1839_002782 [Geoglossum umbratile]|nr:MAG: hypothetical protein M1839_002782 [Geoglossum umbratile]